MNTYRLLDTFKGTFGGVKYRHRSSTLGDKIAGSLYEDMLLLRRSKAFCECVSSRTHGTNKRNQASGLPIRRGDGVFGELVPGVRAVLLTGRDVPSGPLATIEVGVEVKILAKAMIKQVDRVMSDLLRQAEHFRKYGNPICVGFVGINYASYCTSYEGDRAFRTDGSKHAHPCDEAPEAERRIRERVFDKFDHFLFLRYMATNEPPYPFQWLDETRTYEEYGALLTRLSIAVEARLRTSR